MVDMDRNKTATKEEAGWIEGLGGGEEEGLRLIS